MRGLGFGSCLVGRGRADRPCQVLAVGGRGAGGDPPSQVPSALHRPTDRPSPFPASGRQCRVGGYRERAPIPGDGAQAWTPRVSRRGVPKAEGAQSCGPCSPPLGRRPRPPPRLKLSPDRVNPRPVWPELPGVSAHQHPEETVPQDRGPAWTWGGPEPGFPARPARGDAGPPPASAAGLCNVGGLLPTA